MEYPSLLWQDGLSKNKILFPTNNSGKTEPIPGRISTDAIHDLLPDKAFSPLSTAYFRYPCTKDEILSRQAFFRRLSSHGDFHTSLTHAADACNDFEGLYHRWCARELPKHHKPLLFPAVAESWLTLCDTFAALLPEDMADTGYAQVVCEHFRTLLHREDILALREGLAHFSASRGDSVRLTVQSGSVTAYAASSRHVNVLEQYFHDMGITDALPAARIHRADAAVIDAYAAVYPDVVDKAVRLSEKYVPLLMDELSMGELLYFAGEINFAREVVAYGKQLTEMGYPLCMPKIAPGRSVHIRDLRDVSLARRNIRGEDVIPNDVHMAESDKTHFHYVTGANGGGKTTYLRAFGIAILFFVTGCPVSAREAEIWPFTRLCTHFPSPENFEDTGRFVDEMRRADEIRETADHDTVALFNETFSGTDEVKSETCSRALAEDMYHAGTFGLYVTHLHSLTHGEIPTLAAMIDETDENRRTYRIKPIGSTDSSFAVDILKKYDLTEEGLARRLAMMQAKKQSAGTPEKGEHP